jgi:hypothetical protein
MENETKGMMPIWYFVGLMLSAMGIVVFVSGIANYIRPPARQTVLSHLHLDLWWGLLMIAAGVLFFFMNRRTKVE